MRMSRRLIMFIAIEMIHNPVRAVGTQYPLIFILFESFQLSLYCVPTARLGLHLDPICYKYIVPMAHFTHENCNCAIAVNHFNNRIFHSYPCNPRTTWYIFNSLIFFFICNNYTCNLLNSKILITPPPTAFDRCSMKPGRSQWISHLGRLSLFVGCGLP